MTATTTGAEAARKSYDVVIVGAGWAGSLIAKQLGLAGRRVLVLEAGEGGTETWSGYLDSLHTYYSAVLKVPNSAYHRNPAAPSPDVLDLSPVPEGAAKGLGFTANGYFEQKGPMPYRTDYIRALGGAGMHWLGAVPRMHPQDFSTRTDFGYGRDWPLTAAALQPYYARAEWELGVAGDAEEQHELGVITDPGYVYPMHRVPPSHVDDYCRSKLDGRSVTDPMGTKRRLRVTSLPQARNSTPNPAYDPARHGRRKDAQRSGYHPRGAVGLPNYGERCVGNASCIPICPVQAKSSPLRLQAEFTDKVTLATRCVVTSVRKDADGRVRGVEYRTYKDRSPAGAQVHTVDADIVVLAAHAIENARLLLVSKLANSSGQVGRNLMDHPTTVSWALAPGQVGPFRGPGHTSGWEEFRWGDERRYRSPFRIEIANWGWGWPAGAPMSNVATLLGVGGDEHGKVRQSGLFGPELRAGLGSAIGRQISLQLAVEQPANENNRVTVDPVTIRDGMGNPRPVITYDLDEHVRAGLYAAYRVSESIFRRLGATSYTKHVPGSVGYFRYRDTDLTYNGAGHSAGTHIMGTDPADSVVDTEQRTHDCPNLYAVGCGSMPSIGTSNPTLTMAALALRSADRIERDLADLQRPVTLRPVQRSTAAVSEVKK